MADRVNLGRPLQIPGAAVLLLLAAALALFVFSLSSAVETVLALQGCFA